MHAEADNDGDYDDYDRELNELLDGLLEQVKTDAPLLDAAPDLLEALEGLLSLQTRYTNVGLAEFDAARAAIAKAKGRAAT
jgi:hypothetical protein